MCQREFVIHRGHRRGVGAAAVWAGGDTPFVERVRQSEALGDVCAALAHDAAEALRAQLTDEEWGFELIHPRDNEPLAPLLRQLPGGTGARGRDYPRAFGRESRGDIARAGDDGEVNVGSQPQHRAGIVEVRGKDDVPVAFGPRGLRAHHHNVGARPHHFEYAQVRRPVERARRSIWARHGAVSTANHAQAYRAGSVGVQGPQDGFSRLPGDVPRLRVGLRERGERRGHRASFELVFTCDQKYSGPVMTQSLVGRRPRVPADDLIAALRPPPHFASARFNTYVPDPDFPSQSRARDAVRAFGIGATRRGTLRRSSAGKGIYLDGGFGVGKTHLLAALAHAVGDDAAFGTFVEYTNLVGALGFQHTCRELEHFKVVCIDEFELDDPGDTVLMARLMRELADAGVAIAATSNTPPGSLGQGRFAAADFQREIQALSSAFTIVTIDGRDYRSRGDVEFPPPLSDQEVRASCERDKAVCEDWDALIDDLRHVHPSAFGAYVAGIAHLGLVGVAPLADQAQALRFVSLVDRLYDRDVRVVASGTSLDEVFSPAMMSGGYRKKYLRAQSRLLSMIVGERDPRD